MVKGDITASSLFRRKVNTKILSSVESNVDPLYLLQDDDTVLITP